MVIADRYWVAFSGGNWSSTSSWSTTSGGASGASVPTSADRALFPSTAITSAGKTITVDTASNCLDIDFTGLLNAPTFAMSANLSIFGSATFILAMTITGNSNLLFSSTATGKTITTNGLNIPVIIIFQGVGGGWTLQDNYSGNFISHIAGTFDTNSKTVTLSNGLNSTGSTTRVLSLGASVININSTGAITMVATGLTFNEGTSTINMSGSNTTFAGGGLTYYNVNFVGLIVTVSGNNTYNIRTVSAGVTVNNTWGSNQTAASFVDNGTPALAITEQSTIAGTPYTFTKTSGAVIFRHTSIKDCTATGGATFSALESSTNVSGNTGITFGVARTFMQIKPSGTYESLWFEDSSGVLQNLSILPSTKANKIQSAWIAPTLLNGWVNFGGSNAVAGYMKDDFGYVHIKGMIKSGTAVNGTVIFNLPVGYRPLASQQVAISSNGAFGVFIVSGAGDILFAIGSNADFSLNYSFLAEQ